MEQTSKPNSHKQNSRVKRIRQLLSPSQKNDIKKAFDYFDQGGAGKIKKKELKVILRALGFDPTNEELEKLVGEDSKDLENKADAIDFQEFMDIMLAKIEQQLSLEDIKYAFHKIAKIKPKEEKDNNYIYPEDIMELANALDEKLSMEEIEEMLSEAIETGKLTNKDEGVKNIKSKNKQKLNDMTEGIEEHGNMLNTHNRINMHDFKAILKWENN